MLFILSLEMLCKGCERFSTRSFDLERLEFLKSMSLVHSFNNGIDVTDHFLFENVCIVRKNLEIAC